MTPGFHSDVPEPDYHADRDSLSVSGAKTLLKAPALFRWQQEHPVYRDVFDVGSAAHKLVLGVGAPIRRVEAGDWRTKVAQEQRAEARAAGEIPLLAADHDKVQAMADRLAAHPFASSLLASGEAELSAYAPDEETGVLRRCRFDFLADFRGETVGVDYKTAADITEAGFTRAVVNSGYEMQAAWYSGVAEALEVPLAAFCFIAQSKEPPYLVEVYDLDESLMRRGRNRNRQALDTYAECIRTDTWPGFTGRTFTTLTAPRWAREDF